MDNWTALTNKRVASISTWTDRRFGTGSAGRGRRYNRVLCYLQFEETIGACPGGDARRAASGGERTSDFVNALLTSSSSAEQ